MTHEICPLVLDDLSAVGRFLRAGFHAAPDADFAAPEVLRWKYLEPRGEDDEAPRSYLAREEGGHVIGHVGICRTALEGDAIPSGRIATLHMIDWLQRFTLVLHTVRHVGTSRECPGVSRAAAPRPRHHRASSESSPRLDGRFA